MQFFDAPDYQPRTRSLFTLYREKIRQSLPSARIEHIGASAIPGAISKGDLDIFVGVPAATLAAAIPAVESIGFRIKKNTLRTPELCMLESTDASLDLAIQLVADDSSFENFIHFRDALLTDPSRLSAYNAMKRSCVGFTPEAYRRVKSQFVITTLGESADS